MWRSIIDDNVAKFFMHSHFQITDKKCFVWRVLALKNPYLNRKFSVSLLRCGDTISMPYVTDNFC